MKSIFFLLLFLFAINLCSAQMRPIIIVFKTGDTIRGVGKMKSDSVKYKDELNDGEPQEFEFSKIAIVKLVIPQNKSVNYRFFQTKEDSKYLAVQEVVSSGEVALFTTSSSNPLQAQMGITYSAPIENYYLKRKNEETMTGLGPYSPLANNLKDKVLEYFADCSTLVDKLKKGDFRVRRGLTEIVEFYNKNCN
ncbi:hypothetical protein [uncultured Flavobacterium sp.]|uniref:hypothetical protein n=1 Tax=uncultured Flavobacterium sp. TaxID=165435 RepID=UPI0025F9F3D4|nr:hypothetical protein [uncultured Flavobacterium sp.]